MTVSAVNDVTLTLCVAVVVIILLAVRGGQREVADCRNQGGIVTTIEGQNACVKILSMLH